ncbi:MAG TPA: hypothetical protein VFN10_22260 [Thermoanaerobaculia bacterium]|nr:hypothetical protein [Thermoanaerobaculia bacterium]
MKTMSRLILAALLLASVPAFAQSHDWSRTGSTGILDRGSLFNTIFSGPTLRFRSTSSGTVVARYPVTNTFGSGSSTMPGWTTLWATFLDNSSSGSVTATLYGVEKCTNTITQICQVTSSDSPSTQCASCSFSSSTFDFANNTYYVEVTLARTATSAGEEIHSVALD